MLALETMILFFFPFFGLEEPILLPSYSPLITSRAVKLQDWNLESKQFSKTALFKLSKMVHDITSCMQIMYTFEWMVDIFVHNLKN